jgi:transposase-like protein
VFDGLETVQESGETSMQDHQAVQEIAARLGYPETARWVREHRHEYLEGTFRGFVVAE